MSPYAPPAEELHSRIKGYWSHRSRQYAELRRYELESDKRDLWLGEITPHLPRPVAARPLDILDVGTGTGFLAVLMAASGHTVTGVDLSPAMIAMAHQTARDLELRIDFRVMDAARLDIASERFDLLLSRNLTWTLPDAEAAYREWFRVLKPGGVLLNFDADYGKVSFAAQAETAETPQATLPTRRRLRPAARLYGQPSEVREVVDKKRLAEYDAIKQKLSISTVPRPQWDLEVLRQTGFSHCGSDTSLSERIYAQPDITYNPVPMFSLWAEKP